jgi:predicted nuclease of predicted toxin-antitoxin system
MMTVRFQADADLNQILVKATLRREPSIDFQTAHAAGLVSLNDEEVLAIAAKEKRLLVTHDRKTMPGHFAAFIASTSSPGVIVVPQRLALNTAVEDLILIWAASEAEEWTDRIKALPL